MDKKVIVQSEKFETRIRDILVFLLNSISIMLEPNISRWVPVCKLEKKFLIKIRKISGSNITSTEMAYELTIYSNRSDGDVLASMFFIPTVKENTEEFYLVIANGINNLKLFNVPLEVTNNHDILVTIHEYVKKCIADNKTDKQHKIKKKELSSMVDRIVRLASQQSSEGNYHVPYDEMSQLLSVPKEELIKDHEKIIEIINSHPLILADTWTDTDANGKPVGVDMNFCWDDNNDLPVWNRKDNAINLLEQDIRCCDEITEEDESFSFTYELWFDVDRYFETDTKDYDCTWINFYTIYHPETKSVEAIMCIDTDGSNETYSWQLTEDEKEFLLNLMKNYAEQQGITIDTTKKAIFNTKIVEDAKHNGEVVSVYEHNGCQYRVVFPDETEAWAYESELSFIKGENNE